MRLRKSLHVLRLDICFAAVSPRSTQLESASRAAYSAACWVRALILSLSLRLCF